MEALDLKKFLWESKATKGNFIILAITTYKNDDVVVYRESQDRSQICVCSVDDFCRDFSAIYPLN